jgi:hypothetical protein
MDNEMRKWKTHAIAIDFRSWRINILIQEVNDARTLGEGRDLWTGDHDRSKED